jgi:hypothetical protein
MAFYDTSPVLLAYNPQENHQANTREYAQTRQMIPNFGSSSASSAGFQPIKLPHFSSSKSSHQQR